MFLSTFISVFLLCCAVNSDEIVETTTSFADDDIDGHPNVHVLPKTCGLINRKSLAGNTATLYELPWMVPIGYKTSAATRWICYGSIVSPRNLLIGAYCVPDDKNLIIIGHGYLESSNHTDCEGLVCESQLQDIQVDNIIIHPNFTKLPQLQNNIALIRLKEKIDFNRKNIMPICLPVSKKLRNIQLAGKIGTVIGWNLTNADINPSILLQENILIKTNEECKSLISNSTASNSETTSDEICAGGDQNDKCIGETGGPLLVAGVYEGENRFIQYGIRTRKSTDCRSKPGVYTNVAAFMRWILDNLNE